MCGGLSYLVGDLQFHSTVDDIAFQPVQAVRGGADKGGYNSGNL